MRGVHRLRNIAQSHLLPLVLGALVLRALIPVGFMPGARPGMNLTAAMCNPAAGGGPGGSEIIEIPGATPVVHCEYCLAPACGPAPVFLQPGAQPAVDFAAVVSAPPTIYSRCALRGSQSPRGPPHA